MTSATAFGGSGVFAKPLIEAGISPLQVTWLRVAGSALVLLPLAVRHVAVARRHPRLVVTYGLIAIVGCQAFYFGALSRIPVGVAVLVEFMGPVLVLLWLRFAVRRPVSRRAALGVVLAVTGLALVVEVWTGMRFDPLGLLLGFAAACCQAFYFVLGDRDEAEPANPHGVVSYGLLTGTLALTLVSQPWQINWGLLGNTLSVDDRRAPALALLAWVVLVSTVLAYLAGISAIRRLSAQVASAVACLEVVIATALAWFALGEALSMLQVLGGAVVLAGAFIAQTAVVTTARSRQLPEPTPEPAAA